MQFKQTSHTDMNSSEVSFCKKSAFVKKQDLCYKIQSNHYSENGMLIPSTLRVELVTTRSRATLNVQKSEELDNDDKSVCDRPTIFNIFW